MASTKADMRNLVLRYLAKLPEGQVAEDHDASVTEAAIDRCQAFLEAEGVAYWESSAIPDGVSDAFKRYVGAEVAHEFMPPSMAESYAARKDGALRDLRRFTAKTNADVPAVYF